MACANHRALGVPTLLCPVCPSPLPEPGSITNRGPNTSPHITWKSTLQDAAKSMCHGFVWHGNHDVVVSQDALHSEVCFSEQPGLSRSCKAVHYSEWLVHDGAKGILLFDGQVPIQLSARGTTDFRVPWQAHPHPGTNRSNIRIQWAALFPRACSCCDTHNLSRKGFVEARPRLSHAIICEDEFMDIRGDHHHHHLNACIFSSKSKRSRLWKQRQPGEIQACSCSMRAPIRFTCYRRKKTNLTPTRSYLIMAKKESKTRRLRDLIWQ